MTAAGGYDVVAECAGKPGLLDACVTAARTKGRIVVAGVCPEPAPFSSVAALLKEVSIGFAVYYQPPLHLQPALRHLGYAEGDLPETEKAARENLCLPLWAGITEQQQLEVVSVLKRASELVRS